MCPHSYLLKSVLENAVVFRICPFTKKGYQTPRKYTFICPTGRRRKLLQWKLLPGLQRILRIEEFKSVQYRERNVFLLTPPIAAIRRNQPLSCLGLDNLKSLRETLSHPVIPLDHWVVNSCQCAISVRHSQQSKKNVLLSLVLSFGLAALNMLHQTKGWMPLCCVLLASNDVQQCFMKEKQHKKPPPPSLRWLAWPQISSHQSLCNHNCITDGSLEANLPTIWTNGMVEVEKSEKRREKREESRRRRAKG